MRARSTRTVLFVASLLCACGSDTREQTADNNAWCIEEGCSERGDASVDVGGDAGGVFEEVGVDAGGDADAGSDAWMSQPIDADLDPPRPEWISPPTQLGEPSLLVVHEETACALVEGEVHCWGDNAHGRAQPPEDAWGADRLVLTETYGCAVTPPGGIRCWGDGIEDVRAIDGNQMLGRHTLYGASGNAGMLCYSSAYVEESAVVECADADEIWTLGPNGATNIDVQYNQGGDLEPTYCYTWSVGERYGFRCMYDGREIVVGSTGSPGPNPAPMIRHDGEGQVAVLDYTGEVTWYDLELEDIDVVSPEDGVYRATRIDVDWGPLRDEFVRNADTATLVSPNCVFYSNYMLACRDVSGEKMKFIARQSTSIAAVHEQDDGNMTYCFGQGYAGGPGEVAPVCESATR